MAEKEAQIDREIERQTDRKIERQKDRKTQGTSCPIGSCKLQIITPNLAWFICNIYVHIIMYVCLS